MVFGRGQKVAGRVEWRLCPPSPPRSSLNLNCRDPFLCKPPPPCVPRRHRQVSVQREGAGLDAGRRRPGGERAAREHAGGHGGADGAEGPREVSGGDLHGRPASGV